MLNQTTANGKELRVAASHNGGASSESTNRMSQVAIDMVVKDHQSIVVTENAATDVRYYSSVFFVAVFNLSYF